MHHRTTCLLCLCVCTGFYHVSADNALPFTSIATSSLGPSRLLPAPRNLSDFFGARAIRPPGNDSSLRSTQPGCPDTLLVAGWGRRLGPDDTAIFYSLVLQQPRSPPNPSMALVEVVILDALAFYYNDVTSFDVWKAAASGIRF